MRWLSVALAVVRRPDLWITAIRQVFVLAGRSWWTRPPFLPVPSRPYLRFRMVTAYGDADRPPDAADVVTYLGWCRQWRELGLDGDAVRRSR
jgi:hypothetical protein